MIGDPFDNETTIGPMVSIDARNELIRQVEASINAGARLFISGTGILNSDLGYKGAVNEFHKIIRG